MSELSGPAIDSVNVSDQDGRMEGGGGGGWRERGCDVFFLQINDV